MAQTTANLGLAGGEVQTHQSNGNVANAIDPKILPKAAGVLACPICRDTFKPNGKGWGKYSGMKQFAYRCQDYTSQMGSKTCYQG
jgi:hypothetical protein